MENKRTFFVPGCLGTCWYGKYHYLEPFTGCEHNCTYCYGKGRSDVLNILKELKNDFDKPEIGCPQQEALRQIKAEIDADANIHTIKLSRYTDIFSKKFVDNGYSHAVLKLLAEHPQIKRIIITTKGVPNEEIMSLIRKYPQKFSYNAAVKPEGEICMENNVPPREERLKWALKAKEAGALTTIHMDPLIPGVEDKPEIVEPFIAHLKEIGLDRVMFSYLLYDYTIAKNITEQFGEQFFLNLKEKYLDDNRQILPKQSETTYYALKHEIKLESVKNMTAILKKYDMQFVICGLKSSEKDDILSIKACGCNVCDGKFYA